MGRPIKWQTSPVGLREMTDAEIDYVAHQVLVQFAADDTSPFTLTTTASGNTSIGSFTDTYRTEAVGVHPATGATASDTTTIYQNRNSSTINQTALPLEWTTSPADGLREMVQASVSTNIIARAVALYNAQGLGSYALGTSAPAGDTWTAKITIDDEHGGSSGITSTTYYIWRKTARTAPTAVRSMKWQTSPAGIREMTDAEMKLLVNHLREYMRTTGIGQYALQATAPSTGTWVDRGTITDTRQSVTDVNYSGTVGYTGTYYQFADYTGTYYQFADYSGTYYQFADYSGTYRATVGYTGTYRSRIGYAFSGGATYYRFADYSGTYYQFADYTGTYRRTIGYTGTYGTTLGYSGTYRRTIGYTGTYYQFQNYAGLTIQSGTTRDTVTTLKLWQRTA